MNLITKLGASLVLASVALLPSLNSAQATVNPLPSTKAPAVSLSGTIFGHLDFAVEAWVGHALVKIGDAPAKTATLIDQNTSFGGTRKNGSFSGTEKITLTFIDHSGSFEIDGHFQATPGAAPGMYTLHEVGTIGNGTGDYESISGSVVIQGPFVLAEPVLDPGVPPAIPLWISELHGSVSGPHLK